MVTLRRISTEGLSSTLTAEITDEGDLLVSGHDLGRVVEELLGTDEYEYWLTVRAAQLPTVGALLARAFPQVAGPASSGQVLPALQALFADGSFDTDAGLRQWLEDRGVPTEFHSWG